MTTGLARIAVALLACWFAAAGVAAEPLPEPLTLEAALGQLPADLSTETLARQYQETAILARTFECRAQDRVAERESVPSRSCGYWHLLTPSQQTRLEVLRRYLDVMEADLAAALSDEAMAVAYVELDRARNREELGQFSPVAVAELEVAYQRIREDRYQAQARQRASRARLAIAMGRPGELASEVSDPGLPALPLQIEDIEQLTVEGMSGNAVLQDWRKRLETEPSADPVLQQLELHLQEGLLDLWLRYPVLRAALDTDDAEAFYRDLSLDRSRTLYELEVKADLGDAMTEQTRARLARMENTHRAQLLIATLNALRGLPLFPVDPPADEGSSS
jgi:hypothetical protein